MVLFHPLQRQTLKVLASEKISAKHHLGDGQVSGEEFAKRLRGAKGMQTLSLRKLQAKYNFLEVGIHNVSMETVNGYVNSIVDKIKLSKLKSPWQGRVLCSPDKSKSVRMDIFSLAQDYYTRPAGGCLPACLPGTVSLQHLLPGWNKLATALICFLMAKSHRDQGRRC